MGSIERGKNSEKIIHGFENAIKYEIFLILEKIWLESKKTKIKKFEVKKLKEENIFIVKENINRLGFLFEAGELIEVSKKSFENKIYYFRSFVLCEILGTNVDNNED